MEKAFWINAVILFVISSIVGVCGYLIGHVHGFEKGEWETLKNTDLTFDELIFEYCPECKKIQKDEDVLGAEVIQ